MSLPRRRLHQWLSLAYLLVACFAPVAHLHGRSVVSVEPVRLASIDEASLATPSLVDRSCECPACHFSVTHHGLIEFQTRFEAVATDSLGDRSIVETSCERRARSSCRAPPSVRA